MIGTSHLNTIPKTIATLHDRDKSLGKLRESQPALDRLQGGANIPIPPDCVAVLPLHVSTTPRVILC